MDRLDAVVDEEHLPAAVDLAQDRVDEHLLVVLEDLGVHRQAVARRRLDHRHVARAGEAQVERARNRRRGHREHVDLARELADLLLLRHAEAMLLVDHHQPEVRNFTSFDSKPVRADEDVDLALGESREVAF